MRKKKGLISLIQWFFALDLLAASKMNERDLLVRPPNCTQFPFEDASNDKKRGLVSLF
jgi:hypothetical protein